MTHSAFGPTVSLEEAQRIEMETAERLLKARKLSLIVDLDQTIVHATVDPTVGEWITEGEAWEARQAKKAEAATSGINSDSESDDTDDDEDECNPNWHALKDVQKFRLGPEAFGVPLHKNTQRSKGRQKHIENQGCMYYIKPRYIHLAFPVATLTLWIGQAGKISSDNCLPSMRCMFIRWVPEHMQRRFVQPLIQTARYLVVVF